MKSKNSSPMTSSVSLQNSSSSFNLKKSLGWLVFAIGSLVYLNTILHEFTQDDAIVIYDNMYTTKGVSGLKGLFTKDTFYGFFKEEGKAKVVSGGRYRPFTPAMFAIEYQLVGKKPWLGHLINILLYGFLCMMIYKLLQSLINYKDAHERNTWMIFAATLLYATHPLHTEVVANIKGRDEIMSMLGSILALYFLVKNHESNNFKHIIIACFCFFIALLSKENAITYLAVVPLAFYFFRTLSISGALSKSLYLIAPAILFLMIRAAILGNDFGGTPMELMNNPYLEYVDGVYKPIPQGEKFATITFTLGKYIQLLLLPHPLTHDYYPRYIDIKSFGDFDVLLSLLLYGFLIFIAVRGFKTRSLPAFAAGYYLVTLSIVSNIIFPIGTNMSERFMFMPSLGFTLLLAYLLDRFIYSKFGKNAFLASIGLITLLYSFKTITRNNVWKNDFTLFTTDVKTSTNSAKVLNAAGGALTTNAFSEKDENKRKEMLTQALQYLTKAIEIHPLYKNAYLITGNAQYHLGEYEKSVASYRKALQLDPGYKDATVNMAVALRDAGKIAGEKENNLAKAELYLNESLKITTNDPETYRLMGVLNGVKGNHAEAIKYFLKVAEIDSSNANAYLNLSLAYRNVGDNVSADKHLEKAKSLNPNILNQ
jgi:tetratricopeptide (TPR) repeat protein